MFPELSVAKAKTEAAIAARNVGLDVALENLTALDGRVQVTDGAPGPGDGWVGGDGDVWLWGWTGW